MLDRQAVAEKNPERAMKARELARGTKELGCAVQLEF